MYEIVQYIKKLPSKDRFRGRVWFCL